MLKKIRAYSMQTIILGVVLFAVTTGNPYAENLLIFYIPTLFILTILVAVMKQSETWKKSGNEEPKRITSKGFAVLTDFIIIISFASVGWYWLASFQTIQTIFEISIFGTKKELK